MMDNASVINHVVQFAMEHNNVTEYLQYNVPHQLQDVSIMVEIFSILGEQLLLVLSVSLRLIVVVNLALQIYVESVIASPTVGQIHTVPEPRAPTKYAATTLPQPVVVVDKLAVL